MQPPKSFTDSLARQLPHLRIRWSQQWRQWVVEQKVRRSRLPKRRVPDEDDNAIRMRDGYDLVMVVTHGDRMDCPECGCMVHVPTMRMAYAKCTKCSAQFNASMWPLGDMLLEYLRKTDPYRGGIERAMAEVDANNERREHLRTRALRNDVEAATKDLFNPLFQISSVGYTGKERYV